jgi:hypothetical protein
VCCLLATFLAIMQSRHSALRVVIQSDPNNWRGSLRTPSSGMSSSRSGRQQHTGEATSPGVGWGSVAGSPRTPTFRPLSPTKAAGRLNRSTSGVRVRQGVPHVLLKNEHAGEQECVGTSGFNTEQQEDAKAPGNLLFLAISLLYVNEMLRQGFQPRRRWHPCCQCAEALQE